MRPMRQILNTLVTCGMSVHVHWPESLMLYSRVPGWSCGKQAGLACMGHLCHTVGHPAGDVPEAVQSVCLQKEED